MKRITGVNGTVFYDCVSYTVDFLAEHKSYEEIGMVEAETESNALKATELTFLRSPKGISEWQDFRKWRVKRL